MKVTEKFIAFVDIVGFTSMVEAAEAGGGDLTRALELAGALGSVADAEKWPRPARKNARKSGTTSGLEEAIARLRVKAARLDDMIATGRIPYGGTL